MQVLKDLKMVQSYDQFYSSSLEYMITQLHAGGVVMYAFQMQTFAQTKHDIVKMQKHAATRNYSAQAGIPPHARCTAANVKLGRERENQKITAQNERDPLPISQGRSRSGNRPPHGIAPLRF